MGVQTKTISVTRTVVCPLESSERKRQYLRDAIEQYQSVLSEAADLMPSFDSWDRDPSNTNNSLYSPVKKDIVETGSLYAQEPQDAVKKVAEAYASKESNGHSGELPDFGTGHYVRVNSSTCNVDGRCYVSENDRGYGLYIRMLKGHGEGRGTDGEWFHLGGGQYEYDALERIADGDGKLGNVEIHCPEDGEASAHISYSVDVEVPKKGSSDTYVGVDVGDRVLYAVAVCSESGDVQEVEVESGREQRHHRTRLDERQQRRQKSDVVGRGSGVSDKERYTDHVMHRASREIVDIAAEYAPATLVIEDLNFDRQRSPTELHDWPYGSLQEKLCYKANAAGLRVEVVDPSYTSQTCRKCGVVDKQSRPNHGVEFQCTNCDYQVHADVNAAINLAGRGVRECS